MLGREIIQVYFKNQMKPLYSACDQNSEWFKVKAFGSEVKLHFCKHFNLMSGIKIIRNVIRRMTIDLDRRSERIRGVHITTCCWSLKYVTGVLLVSVKVS